MERESFEDPETAAYMNEHFVSVKVDREERPDVDAIYMEAVQAMTGHGGWPMTVFLDPDGVPFYGGTYFPPERAPRDAELPDGDGGRRRRRGRPSASEIRERGGADPRRSSARSARIEPSRRAARAERARRRGRERCATRADLRPRRLRRRAEVPARLGARAAAGPRRAPTSVERDPRRDGAPAASTTSSAAASPATRSTRVWLVPHFEKMLYDNALLARAYLHGWQALGHERYRRVCERDARLGAARDARPRGRLLLGARRRLRGRGGPLLRLDAGRDPRGARASDAEAGDRLLRGHRARATSRAATSSTSPAAPTPSRRRGSSEARARALRGARRSGSGRASTTSASPPGTRWRSPRWPRPARCSAAPTTSTPRAPAPSSCSTRDARRATGRLLRTYKDGEAQLNAYLEDHAFLLEALLTLYEATFELRWFDAARELADAMIERFGDPERGGFFTTSADHEELIARRKDIDDHPIPSGNSSAALGLLRLAALTGERALRASRPRASSRLFGRVAATPPRGRRPPAAGARLPPRAGPRGGAGRAGDATARPSSPPSCARALPPPPRPRRRAGGDRAPRADARAHARSTAARPPTSARASPAGRRSPSPSELAAALDG